MTTLQRVGFYRQMHHGEPTDPDITTASAAAAGPDEELLASYLDAGHVYIATPRIVTDVIDGQTLIGPAHYLTDGTYVWPGDVAYYVRRYHVRLPDGFVDHARSSGWAVPASVDLSGLDL
jgi:hypothetical protein